MEPGKSLSKDGNGRISVDELGVVLKALGRTPQLGGEAEKLRS